MKRNGLQSARDLIRKRQAAEDKLPTTKGKRSAHHALRRVSEVPEVMDVDDEATQETLAGDDDLEEIGSQAGEPEAGLARAARRKKATVSQPKLSKGLKNILETMKSGHPTSVLRNQFRSEMSYWAEFYQMSKELEEEFAMILRGQRLKENFVLSDPVNGLICVGRLGGVYENPRVGNLGDMIN